MEIIVPAAGLSSRFPNTRPKYLLYDYAGSLMLKKSVEPYLGKYPITIGILKEHDIRYDAKEVICRELGGVNIVIIDSITRGPADTVNKILKSIDRDIEFLVKDCDSFFNHDYHNGNVIYTSNIEQHLQLNRINSKSFLKINDNNIVIDIIEKQVISNTFCIGAYKFDSSDQYQEAFFHIEKNTSREIYVSNVITYMIANNQVFHNINIEKYIDVGTLDDWNQFNYKPTIFCDIDGTLVKSMARPYNGDYEILEKNYTIIKKEYERGCQIIFTTARPSSSRIVTELMLRQLGFGEDCKLIMDLHNSRRILINDYHPTNVYPSAISYNVKRDQDDLNELYR